MLCVVCPFDVTFYWSGIETSGLGVLLKLQKIRKNSSCNDPKPIQLESDKQIVAHGKIFIRFFVCLMFSTHVKRLGKGYK